MLDPRSQFGPAAEKYLTSAVHSDPDALSRLVEIARPDGGIWLDIGTGAGHTAFAFAPRVDRVIASDITGEMLKVVRKAAKDRNLRNLDCCFSDASALPLRSGSLSGITCRLAAHHFPNVEGFLSEVRRALKPGGKFLLVDTVGIEDDDEADQSLHTFESLRDPSHVRNLRTSEWRAKIEAAGFRVEHVEGHRKTLEAIEWMDRMRVPAETRPRILGILENAAGPLKEYLQPWEEGGKPHFYLWESIILACATM